MINSICTISYADKSHPNRHATLLFAIYSQGPLAK